MGMAKKVLDALITELRTSFTVVTCTTSGLSWVLYPDSQSLHAEQRVSRERDEGAVHGICCSGQRGRTPHGCSGRPRPHSSDPSRGKGSAHRR